MNETSGQRFGHIVPCAPIRPKEKAQSSVEDGLSTTGNGREASHTEFLKKSVILRRSRAAYRLPPLELGQSWPTQGRSK
jgi:hypothetical protein